MESKESRPSVKLMMKCEIDDENYDVSKATNEILGGLALAVLTLQTAPVAPVKPVPSVAKRCRPTLYFVTVGSKTRAPPLDLTPK